EHFLSPNENRSASEQYVGQRQRQHDFPAKGHELIKTRTWKSRPQQNEERNEAECLDQKPNHSWENRAQPASKEKDGNHGRDQSDTHILSDEEHAKFHS